VVRAFGDRWIVPALQRIAPERPGTIQNAIQNKRSDHKADDRDKKNDLSVERRLIIRPSPFFECCHPREAKQEEASDEHTEHMNDYRSSHDFYLKSSSAPK
jgi:hypothetical protein